KTKVLPDHIRANGCEKNVRRGVHYNGAGRINPIAACGFLNLGDKSLVESAIHLFPTLLLIAEEKAGAGRPAKHTARGIVHRLQPGKLSLQVDRSNRPGLSFIITFQHSDPARTKKESLGCQ